MNDTFLKKKKKSGVERGLFVIGVVDMCALLLDIISVLLSFVIVTLIVLMTIRVLLLCGLLIECLNVNQWCCV